MSTAVVLICDAGFLVPTVGAALSARRHLGDPSVAVTILLIDPPPALLDRLAATLQSSGVQVRGVSLPDLDRLDRATFNPTHVPPASLARLWIDELLDPAVDRFLYLDGDVDITGSLDPLLAQPVPAGGFLAAPDLPFLIARDRGNAAGATRTYLDRLGIRDAEDYFNAGVILADRRGWRRVAREARTFFLRHPDRCRYHDQSALNAVAGRARGELSRLWNYQADFMAVGDPRRWGYEPRIWHFTGFPKAWHGAVFPWGPEFGQSFRLGEAALQGLPRPMRPEPEHDVASGRVMRDRLRHRLTWVYPWRRWRRARRIHAALDRAASPITPFERGNLVDRTGHGQPVRG